MINRRHYPHVAGEELQAVSGTSDEHSRGIYRDEGAIIFPCS